MYRISNAYDVLKYLLLLTRRFGGCDDLLTTKISEAFDTIQIIMTIFRINDDFIFTILVSYLVSYGDTFYIYIYIYIYLKMSGLSCYVQTEEVEHAEEGDVNTQKIFMMAQNKFAKKNEKLIHQVRVGYV